MKKVTARAKARIAALEEVRARNRRGVLLPAEVVKAARSPRSPLHDRFEWDDSLAADSFRMWQARMLITEFEIVMTKARGSGTVVPFYLSLPKDRAAGGGYRPTSEVMSDAAMRRQLLASIATDLESFYSQWGGISLVMRELGPVLRAHDQFRALYVRALPMKKKKAG